MSSRRPDAAAPVTPSASSSAAPATGPRLIPGWARVFGDGRMESATSIVPAPDGGLFVAGTLGCPDGVGRQSPNPNAEEPVCDRAFVARYTRAGERTWIWMAGQGESWADSLALADDGSLTLTGSFIGDVNFDPSGAGATLRAPWSQHTTAFTTHLDANGRHLRSERGRRSRDQSLATLPDGGMLFADSHRTRASGRATFVAALVKAGPDGRNIWSRTFDAQPASLLDHATVLADGSIYVTGSYHPTAEDDGTVFFAKLDATGAIAWVRTLESDNSMVTAMAVAHDGSLVLGGHGGRGEIDLDPGPGVDRVRPGLGELVWVLRVRPDGDRAWAYSFTAMNRRLGDLTIGPDEAVTVVVSGMGDVNFGTTASPDPRSFDASPEYLIRLGAEGRYEGAIALTSQPRMGPYGGPLRGDIGVGAMTFDASGALLIAGNVRQTADLRLSDSPPQRDVVDDVFDVLVARIEPAAFTPAALAAERAH